jgi:hypothetical protein
MFCPTGLERAGLLDIGKLNDDRGVGSKGVKFDDDKRIGSEGVKFDGAC